MKSEESDVLMYVLLKRIPSVLRTKRWLAHVSPVDARSTAWPLVLYYETAPWNEEDTTGFEVFYNIRA